jgi:hypothetical protein
MGEEGKIQQDNQSLKKGWRSKKLSKSKRGVGGSRTFPTWKRGFEVQEELGKEKERNQINLRERENSRGARDEIDLRKKGA